MIAFRNPVNGYIEKVDHPGLWCLLFGCFYFAAKGVWLHAVMAAILAFMTVGISWLVYPFFASKIIETYYLRLGWEKVGASAINPAAMPQRPHPSIVEDRRSALLWRPVRVVFWTLAISFSAIMAFSVIFVLVSASQMLSPQSSQEPTKKAAPTLPTKRPPPHQ